MKTAIAFGVFDGLHPGHRAVLEATKGYKRMAVTFFHLPKFDNKDTGLLFTLEDRKSALALLGMEEVVCLDLEKYKDMPPKDFLDAITEKYDTALIACGENFRFGKGAAGDVSLLKTYTEKKNIKLAVVPIMQGENGAISSSYLRALLKEGNIALANKYLYKPFHITAIVKSGDKRGRELGFPTINQELPQGLLKPKSGVYAAKTVINGKEYKAVTDIGTRPTYAIDHIAAETHIIGYSGDLYGKEITVYLEKFLRPEQKFNSRNELINAINNDITEVLK